MTPVAEIELASPRPTRCGEMEDRVRPDATSLRDRVPRIASVDEDIDAFDDGGLRATNVGRPLSCGAQFAVARTGDELARPASGTGIRMRISETFLAGCGAQPEDEEECQQHDTMTPARMSMFGARSRRIIGGDGTEHHQIPRRRMGVSRSIMPPVAPARKCSASGILLSVVGDAGPRRG